jgi:FkbM family methyltransferase
MKQTFQIEDWPKDRLSRWKAYFQSGIILERIRVKLGKVARRRRRKQWKKMEQAGRVSFVHAIQPGVKMHFFLGNELSRALYAKDYEAEERHFHNTFLKPGDIYLDIGANMGLFSLIAARRVGAKGQVHAVEPCSATFRRLEENLRLNGLRNVRPHQLAISDQPGKVDMTVSLDGYDAWNSLASPASGRVLATESVTAARLDDFIHQQGLEGRITMIKIDVEGWEAHVLAGGRETLSAPSAPVLQVEFAEHAARAAGSSPANLYQALTGLGYQMYRYDPRQRTLIPIRLDEISGPYTNLVAAKDSAAVIARLKGKHP